jgi:hypothetical protein
MPASGFAVYDVADEFALKRLEVATVHVKARMTVIGSRNGA